MNIFTIANLSCGIACIVLAAITLIFGKTKLHRILLWFNIAVAYWGIGLVIVGGTIIPTMAVFGWRVAHFGGLFIATLFYHLVCVFCGVKRTKMLFFAYAQSIIFNLLNVGLNQFSNETRLTFGLYYNKANIFFYLSVICYLVLLVLSYRELLKFLPKAKGHKRSQTLYIIFGFLFGFIGGTSTFLPEFGIDIIYPFGNLGITVYVIVLTYAILKYRLMDIRVFVSRAVAFLISYPLFLGVPFVFAYRMKWVLYPLLGMNWWLAPTALLVFFATLAPLAYDQIRRRMENALLAEQKRYQKLLLQAASGMVTEHNLNRLAKLIVYIVKRIVKIKFAAIFLDDKGKEVYRLTAVRDSGEPSYNDITFLYEHPFIDYLKKHKDPFLYEELPLEMKNSLRIPSQIDLIVPSLIENNLLGFVLLGEKSNRQPYTQDDIDVFKTLSNQAALAIENCVFLEEFKQAQEKIFAAEKLASIGGLIDGVTHQIRNRLNQFSVAGGELQYEIKDFVKNYPELIAQNPKLKETFDYLMKGATSVVSNVQRTAMMIDSIVNFSKIEEKDKLFSYFSLRELIGSAIEMLKVKHGLADFPLEVKLPKDDTIYAVKAQFRECPYNLLDNCYEAIQEKRDYRLSEKEKENFKPFIKLELIQTEDYSLIKISDNGVGIKEEDKKKIFSPLFTTKSSYKSGMGMGMYIVKRMIEENHKGRIWFESEYMKGTTFYIKLPKKGKKL